MEQINFQSLSEQQLVSYQNNDLAILKNIHDLVHITSDNILIDSFMFAVINQGQAQIYIDDQICNLQAGDIFVCKPNRILKKSMLSMDFDAFAVLFHLNYVDKIIKELNLGSVFLQLLGDYDTVHCEPSELNQIQCYAQLLQDKLNMPDSTYKTKSIDTLFLSMIYEIKDIDLRTGKPLKQVTLSSSGNIMNRFFTMLNEKDKPYLNVEGYAEKLNITAKYFSLVCKKTTGKTASQLINEEIIHTAQNKLKDSQYTIQQIASIMGFANQSHFGVFFHRHTGMSPQKYRKSNL